MVEAGRAIGPNVDDLVRRARARWCAIGDVDARRSCEVHACTGNPVFDASADDRVDVVAAVVHELDGSGLGPGQPAVERLHELVRPVTRRADLEVGHRHVHDPVAVGADCAAAPIAVLEVRGGRCDLPGHPGVATVARDRDPHG